MALKDSRRKLAATLCAVSAATALEAQTVLKLPKNKYTPEQDVKVGLEAAAEVRKQDPLIQDERIAKYVRATRTPPKPRTPGSSSVTSPARRIGQSIRLTEVR